MHIAINARHLAEPHVGIGQHLRRLLEGISQHLSLPENSELRDRIRITLISPLPASDPEVNSLIKGPISLEVLPETKFGKQYWEQYQIGAFANSLSADIFWNPYPCLVRNFTGKIATTVHDLIPWQHSAYCKSFRSLFARAFARKGILRSDFVFTVSNTAGKEFTSFFPQCPIPVVIHNSLPSDFYLSPSPQDLRTIRFKYGLHKPYFLYVGGYDVRKRASLLIDSLDGICESRNWDLALVGKQSRSSSLYEDPFSLSHNRQFILPLGFVPDKDLALLLSDAEALVHSSTHEGFNIPLLAASAVGCPIIAEDIQINREIAPDGYYGDMSDIKWIEETIETSFSERKSRSLQLKQHASRYTALSAANVFLDTLLKESSL